jgi:phosphatidylglycerol---prolipoprotein diacylglyceryl transferase
VFPVLFRLPEWLPLLGGEPITSFGVMMLLSFLTGGVVLRARLKEAGYDPELAWDLLFAGVLGGVIGAKVYYLFLHFPSLVEDPGGMIFSRGGLVWYGGFLGGAGAMAWQIRRLKLPLGEVLDFTAPAVALAYAVGRVGCFLVGDDYGRPTDSWVGVAFPEGAPPSRVDILEQQFGITVDPALVEKYGQVVPVHPTQLYEVGISTAFFFLLWKIREHDHRKGWLFLLWLVMAGVERFFIEFFRAKDDRYFGLFTMAQVTSTFLVAGGLIGLLRLRISGGRGDDARPLREVA